MPSLAHERARLIIMQILISLLAPGSLVAAELALLWNPKNLRDHLLPDIMVALGAGEDDPVYGVLRKQYRIWHEDGPPDLVIELASKTTVGRDKLGKKEDYAALGVREYVQFDPLEEFLQPGLQAYRLRDGVYEAVAPADDGSMPSLALIGYDWVRDGIYLRLRDRATERLVPTPEEARAREAARARAAERAERAAKARAAAEAERAEAEAHARAAAEAERDQAAARAAAAENEVARLQAQIARLQANLPPE
jgi:Uma2 family endonuclease